MIQDLLGAVASSQAYRRFAAQKAARTFFYLCFASFLFTIAGAISMRLRLGPAIDETFAWLEAKAPTLTFAGGKVTSAAAGPTRLVHPSLPTEIAVMIDTSRMAPVQARDMREAKVIAYLTGNALYVDERRGSIRAYDLSKAGLERPTTIDANFFRETRSALKSVVYPIAVVAIFLFAAAWMALAGLLYALLGMIFNALAGGSLAFGSLYQLAIPAQTAAVLLRIALMFLPVRVPMSGLLAIMITSVYLWMGVRANAGPAPDA